MPEESEPFEAAVAEVFEFYKRKIDEYTELAKDAATDCDFKTMLIDFKTAVVFLEGVKDVFISPPKEVEEYYEKRRRQLIERDIPEIAEEIKKCVIQR